MVYNEHVKKEKGSLKQLDDKSQSKLDFRKYFAWLLTLSIQVRNKKKKRKFAK